MVWFTCYMLRVGHPGIRASFGCCGLCAFLTHWLRNTVDVFTLPTLQFIGIVGWSLFILPDKQAGSGMRLRRVAVCL